jgi:sugar phosphate permease
MEPAAPTSPGRPTNVRWGIFGLACAASWLLYLHRYAWGVIKPDFLKENRNLTATEVGWLDSSFQATYALGQVPGGLAGDVFGPRGVMTVITLLWSVAAAGVAWTVGFWPLAAVRAAFGLAQAAAYPVIGKVTRNWFPASVRTSVQGVVTAAGRIGAACCPLILGTLLMGALGLSWQESLGVLVLPGVLLAAALWLVLRDSPRQHPWANAAERQLVGEPPPPAAGERRGLMLNRGSGLTLGMLLLYAFASTFQDQLYVYWIPLFLADEHGMDAAERGLFAPLPLLGGAVGGILGGVLNDVLIRRTGNRRWVRSGVALTGKLVAAVLVLVAVQMPDGQTAMLVLLAARVFGDWSLATQWGTITDIGGRAAATVFGLVNAVGALGGFVAGPVLGYLKDHHGWEGLFLGVAVMCLVSALTWLFIDCTRRLVAD